MLACSRRLTNLAAADERSELRPPVLRRVKGLNWSPGASCRPEAGTTNDSWNGMSIRDQYIQAFETIRGRYGEESSGWKIDSNVSLKKAIGYTGRYVVRHERPHFRYDYYREVLCKAMRDLHYDPVNRTILCMDLGCGPGLFSWVVQDYMSDLSVEEGNVEIAGYDHAKSMIQLSNIFHDYFRDGRSTRYGWHGCSKVGRLQRALMLRNFSNYDIIVTFGHVLIQIKNDLRAMRELSGIIWSLSPFKSCTVIAADAYFSDGRRQAFRDSCERLWRALQEPGMSSEHRPLSDRHSYTYARLSAWK